MVEQWHAYKCIHLTLTSLQFPEFKPRHTQKKQWIMQRERRELIFCLRLFWKLKCKINELGFLLSHNFKKVNVKKKSVINHKWKHRRRLSSIFPVESATCSAISRISSWNDLWLTVGLCSLNNAFSCYMFRYNWVCACSNKPSRGESVCFPLTDRLIKANFLSWQLKTSALSYDAISGQTRPQFEAQFRPEGWSRGAGHVAQVWTGL